MNARIDINVQRLNFPLKSLFARQFASFRAIVTNVPGDYSGVFLRLFSADLSSFTDYPAAIAPTTNTPQPTTLNWKLCIPSLAFHTAGTHTYELHAEAEDGDKAALGRGVCTVLPFSQGGAAPAAGTPISVAKMPTRDGGFVNCWATVDETGEYTYEFEKVEEDET